MSLQDVKLAHQYSSNIGVSRKEVHSLLSFRIKPSKAGYSQVQAHGEVHSPANNHYQGSVEESCLKGGTEDVR